MSENPLRAEKRKKLHELKKLGINPFPYSFEGKTSLKVLRERYDSVLKATDKTQDRFNVAGRLMTLRSMGKASFFSIQDQEGHLQIYFKNEELPALTQTAFGLVDLGDIVGIKGFIFKTQRGELSIHCESFEILTKTLEPLPEKFHGIQDIEIKYRHRHLGLISDMESRKVFQTRSQVISDIRRFLDERGFLEVETPVLQPIYGGASAYPFSTHHRALDMKLFLKISPELYLKRLLVGGFEKVYEISKNFRNEGIDRTHNPEFTMLEFYEAYTDYNYQMKQFEDLICQLVIKFKGSYKFNYQGREMDFTPPWRRLRIEDALNEKFKFQITAQKPAAIFDLLKRHGSDIEKPLSMGEMMMELFELTCEGELWNPTFVMDHPVEISPLTKVHRSNPIWVERFEPFAAGMELGNSFSELNDPEEQFSRLQDQEAKRVVDEEAQPMDEDFLHAIDTGMPPTGGVGIGIERIVMLLTDRNSIKDIILFPTMKIKKS